MNDGGALAELAGRIGEIVRAEFSDIPDITELIRVSLRLTIAATLGALIGYDREMKGKAAGLRTHMLVALGAAMFVLVPQQAGASSEDLARVIQGLVAGIGFLGTGAIIKLVDRQEALGLTTAASIWLTAAVGVAAGLGREASALLCTAFALVILALVPRLEAMLDRRRDRSADASADSTKE